ncbi:unnamed protein product [Cuscuta epithymum]|uniref:MORF/ORRM1/DAG-like MORF domain-containing protein n=1 Tax=Cuscuta epithymum TaxID=186058 RepID=A0AAV0CPG6_9ASTE|nr:unnamed protein product [Cuscuta epithymum]
MALRTIVSGVKRRLLPPPANRSPHIPSSLHVVRCCASVSSILTLTTCCIECAEIMLHFPRMDFERWRVSVEYPNDEDDEEPEDEEKSIDFYTKTLTKVVGSGEEAKKRVYDVISFNRKHYTFAYKVDSNTSCKIQDVPTVWGNRPYLNPLNPRAAIKSVEPKAVVSVRMETFDE